MRFDEYIKELLGEIVFIDNIDAARNFINDDISIYDRKDDPRIYKYYKNDVMIFAKDYDLLWETKGKELEKYGEYCRIYSIKDYLNIKLFCKNRFLSAKELFKFSQFNMSKSTKFSKEHFDELLTLVQDDLFDYYKTHNQNILDYYLEKWITDKDFYFKYIDRYKKRSNTILKGLVKSNPSFFIMRNTQDEEIIGKIGRYYISTRFMLFVGSGYQYRYISFDNSFDYFLHFILSDMMREYENELRKKLRIPQIGEGWTSETNLLYNIRKAFPDIQVVHQASPKWLGKQRFDIYFPKYNIAIEYQGLQHFKPIDFFGGEEGFKQTLERDRRKKELCDSNKCILIYVTENYNLEDVINQIKNAIKQTVN